MNINRLRASRRRALAPCALSLSLSALVNVTRSLPTSLPPLSATSAPTDRRRAMCQYPHRGFAETGPSCTSARARRRAGCAHGGPGVHRRRPHLAALLGSGSTSTACCDARACMARHGLGRVQLAHAGARRAPGGRGGGLPVSPYTWLGPVVGARRGRRLRYPKPEALDAAARRGRRCFPARRARSRPASACRVSGARLLLHSSSRRSPTAHDAYGGPFEHRLRLLCEGCRRCAAVAPRPVTSAWSTECRRRFDVYDRARARLPARWRRSRRLLVAHRAALKTPWTGYGAPRERAGDTCMPTCAVGC